MRWRLPTSLWPLLLIVLAAGVWAQDDAEAQRLAKFKAVFIYSFIDYVQWPDPAATDDFVIGVAGDSTDTDILPYLQQIAPRRKVGQRNIVVRVIGEPTATNRSVEAYDILFLPASATASIDTVCARLANAPTLTVGDTHGYAHRGVGINFVLVEGRLKFEINRGAVTAMGLKMSSELLKLATIYE